MITVYGYSPSGVPQVTPVARPSRARVSLGRDRHLSGYPVIRDWLDRVRAEPGFVAMPAVAIENAALIAQSCA